MEVEGAVEGYYNGVASDKSKVDEEPLKKRVPGDEPPSGNGCFDCNICLEFATDPVVTLCGHLYCWPCIYKWLQTKRTAPPQCPVCKASLSQAALVPLYGRGHTSNAKESLGIPRRPPSVYRMDDEQLDVDEPPVMSGRPHHHHHHHHHHHQHHDYDNYYTQSEPYWPMESRVFRSTAGGVLEGMAVSMLPWMFRNFESLYYSRPQLTVGANNPRLRRQEMQAERLLNQIWSFLFCCAIVCLLLF